MVYKIKKNKQILRPKEKITKKPTSSISTPTIKKKNEKKIMKKPSIPIPPIPISTMSTRTIQTYFPIFCSLFKSWRNVYPAPIHPPPIHYVNISHAGFNNEIMKNNNSDLTFDKKIIEHLYSCNNRPDLSSGDFLCYMINVIKYIPSSNHFVAAVKYNRILYFFNSWGEGRSNKFVELDNKIINKLKNYIDEKYPNPNNTIQRVIQYNGKALQTETVSGNSGINVSVMVKGRKKSKKILVPGGFCGLVSLDFIVLMWLLNFYSMELVNNDAFNRYISQLGNLGMVAGGRSTSRPASQKYGKPVARLEQAVKSQMGEPYISAKPGNVILQPGNYTERRGKYILVFEPDRRAEYFNTKYDLVNYLTNMKNQGVNLLNYSIGKLKNPLNRKQITNAGGPSTGPSMYKIPFKNLFNNVNNAFVNQRRSIPNHLVNFKKLYDGYLLNKNGVLANLSKNKKYKLLNNGISVNETGNESISGHFNKAKLGILITDLRKILNNNNMSL
jgi:hypothetical protein